MGAVIARTVMHLALSPGWMALFADPVFHRKIVKKEREIPVALMLGLLITAIGIIYISAAIIVTL